jgi:ketosteroid isomerase-like protein
MSKENIEVVQRFIAAINRRDVDTALESVSADCEVDLSNSRGPESRVYQGRDQAREFFNAFMEAWASLRWDPEEMIELEGDRVLTVSQFRVRGHASGIDVTVKGASIWTIRNGEATALTIYQSKAEAVEAAGPSE